MMFDMDFDSCGSADREKAVSSGLSLYIEWDGSWSENREVFGRPVYRSEVAGTAEELEREEVRLDLSLPGLARNILRRDEGSMMEQMSL
jgi:hypothetical protein